MEELLRTQSGNFTLEESMTLSQVEEAVANGTIGEKSFLLKMYFPCIRRLSVHRKETGFLVMEIQFRKNWYRAAAGKKKSGCIKAAETSQEYTAGMKENRNMFPSACSLYKFLQKLAGADMEYLKIDGEFPRLSGSAVTLGKFDGIHRGHRKLVERILEQKKRDFRQFSFPWESEAR